MVTFLLQTFYLLLDGPEFVLYVCNKSRCTYTYVFDPSSVLVGE